MPETKWAAGRRVHMRADASPLLFVIVDTEEEFDWNAPFSRANTSVRAMDHIGRLQQVFATRGITPTYVVDYPVASQPGGFGPLKQFADQGGARIGAHLHPWVTPPFAEEVSGRNSYACNLGGTLETEKIKVLQTQIAESFGRTPVVYKAGRYGFAETTAAALETLGFLVDVSVNPRMNYTSEGGPSFDDFDTTPFVFGEQRRLLEVPCSTDYTGIAGPVAPWLHRAISHPSLKVTRIVGVMSRLGIVNKIMLSPEGSSLDEMKAVTTSLRRRGVRTFSLTMHSPTVKAGCTPYARTQAEVDRFLDRVAAYCDFFLELGGAPTTPEDFFESLERGSLQERLA